MSQVVCENINEVNNTRNLPSSLPDEDTQASWDLVRLKMASPEFRQQVPAPIIENRPPPFEFTDSLSRPSALIESRSFKPLYPIPSPSKDESNIYNWIPTGEALVGNTKHEVQAIETALEHAKLKLAHARYILAKTAFILQPIHRVPLELWIEIFELAHNREGGWPATSLESLATPRFGTLSTCGLRVDPITEKRTTLKYVAQSNILDVILSTKQDQLDSQLLTDVFSGRHIKNIRRLAIHDLYSATGSLARKMFGQSTSIPVVHELYLVGVPWSTPEQPSFSTLPAWATNLLPEQLHPEIHVNIGVTALTLIHSVRSRSCHWEEFFLPAIADSGLVELVNLIEFEYIVPWNWRPGTTTFEAVKIPNLERLRLHGSLRHTEVLSEASDRFHHDLSTFYDAAPRYFPVSRVERHHDTPKPRVLRLAEGGNPRTGPSVLDEENSAREVLLMMQSRFESKLRFLDFKSKREERSKWQRSIREWESHWISAWDSPVQLPYGSDWNLAHDARLAVEEYKVMHETNGVERTTYKSNGRANQMDALTRIEANTEEMRRYTVPIRKNRPRTENTHRLAERSQKLYHATIKTIQSTPKDQRRRTNEGRFFKNETTQIQHGQSATVPNKDANLKASVPANHMISEHDKRQIDPRGSLKKKALHSARSPNLARPRLRSVVFCLALLGQRRQKAKQNSDLQPPCARKKPPLKPTLAGHLGPCNATPKNKSMESVKSAPLQRFLQMIDEVSMPFANRISSMTVENETEEEVKMVTDLMAQYSWPRLQKLALKPSSDFHLNIASPRQSPLSIFPSVHALTLRESHNGEWNAFDDIMRALIQIRPLRLDKIKTTKPHPNRSVKMADTLHMLHFCDENAEQAGILQGLEVGLLDRLTIRAYDSSDLRHATSSNPSMFAHSQAVSISQRNDDTREGSLAALMGMRDVVRLDMELCGSVCVAALRDFVSQDGEVNCFEDVRCGGEFNAEDMQ
ncbi:hypothetical protein R3P38DRAFT_2775091 [Favolaschia claudopus]|uniref:F-box domain-containing protein n=1 Tax=Favolaschia claudopus TaxID=2862362 RepID=A0AAW0BVX6_9AGAR